MVSKCTVPPFGHEAIHGKVNLILHGYKMNVMTHGLEKRSPSLPLGIDVQTVYATLADGSNRITVVLRNNTRDWVEIKKGVHVACMVAANEVPMQSAFSQNYAKNFLPVSLFLGYSVATCICCPKCALVLGNGSERFCTSRPLLGSYVHQESMLNKM